MWPALLVISRVVLILLLAVILAILGLMILYAFIDRGFGVIFALAIPGIPIWFITLGVWVFMRYASAMVREQDEEAKALRYEVTRATQGW